MFNKTFVLASLLQLEKGKISEAFRQARPATEGYARLKDALVQYHGYQDAGGWTEVPEGKALKLGDKDVRVAQVRARLAVTGYAILHEYQPSSQMF